MKEEKEEDVVLSSRFWRSRGLIVPMQLDLV
jgi:hypothetical protein